MGYTDVELLWSFGNFGRTTEQVRAALDHEGLRAPSAHVSPTVVLVGWERSLAIAHRLGHEYLIVPSFTSDTTRSLDDWREWADRFNAAGAAARRAGIWLAFHNEADHMTPIAGTVPYDVFVQRTDPTVVRHQLDVGNLIMGGGLPCADAVADRLRPARPASPESPQRPGPTNEQPVPDRALGRSILQRGRPHVAIVSLVPVGHGVQEVTVELRSAVAHLVGLHARAALGSEPTDRKRLGPSALGLADRERVVGAISDRDRVRDVGLAACASPGQLGLRPEHLRAQERQPEREETCTHLILLVVVALTSRRTRRIPRAGTRSPCIPDRGGCRSWRYSIPARSTP